MEHLSSASSYALSCFHPFSCMGGNSISLRTLLYTSLHHSVCFPQTPAGDSDDMCLTVCAYGCASRMFSLLHLLKSAPEDDHAFRWPALLCIFSSCHNVSPFSSLVSIYWPLGFKFYHLPSGVVWGQVQGWRVGEWDW